jgi:hypothetical protein
MKYIKTFESFSPINEEEISFAGIKKGIEGVVKGKFTIDLDGYKPSESAILYEQKSIGKQPKLYEGWVKKMKEKNPESKLTIEMAKLFYQALFDYTNKGISIDDVKNSNYLAPSLAGKDVTFNEEENSFSVQAGKGNWFSYTKTF